MGFLVSSFFVVRSAALVANGPKSNPIKCSPEGESGLSPGTPHNDLSFAYLGWRFPREREAGPLMKPTFGCCGLVSVEERERKNE